MIIDSHAHVMLPVEKHLSLMDEANIDKTILFSTTIHPETTSSTEEFENELAKLHRIISGKTNSLAAKIASLEEQRRIIDLYPDKFIGFGTMPADLDYDTATSWIDKYVLGNGFVGLGEFTLAPGQVMQLEPVFKSSRDFAGLPIWIHAFFPMTLEDIQNIFVLAKQYPEVPVIIGHLGGMHWLEVIKLAKENKNVYIDLSASYAMIALKMTIEALPERCLFSSDLPYGDLVTSRFCVERVCKDETTSRQVLGENIAKLLKL